jgi:hypothetical protein
MNERTVVTTTPAVPEASALFRRISWGAIFAGLIITLVAQMTFTLLGAAVGAAAIEPGGEQENVKALALGSVLWLIVTGLISIFLGACVAGRLSGGPTRADGMLHGFVTWGTATLVATLLLTTAIGSLFGGAIGLVSRTFATATHGAGTAPMISGMVKGSAIEVPEAAKFAAENPQLGVALGRMFARGGPQASPSDRDAVISMLVSQHGMTQEQAAATLDGWNQQYQQMRVQAEQRGKEIGQTAATGVSRAAWGGFIALLLGAAVSAWGGWSGSKSALTHTVVERDVRVAT